ncbi:MAG: hypothetical protein BGO26_07620 [Actinobacteria bacterium 69-20]|jgi:F0F1-type ATP synthase assembly protein I|nr:MAG: hypothetical protein BGO26_07620 [Actinobacteria bacterium 69-20]
MFKRSAPTRAPSGAQLGWAATSTLLGGLVVWGGVGWLLDHWWGTRFATPIGTILGMALGVYAVVARYGRAPEDERHRPADSRESAPTRSER